MKYTHWEGRILGEVTLPDGTTGIRQEQVEVVEELPWWRWAWRWLVAWF